MRIPFFSSRTAKQQRKETKEGETQAHKKVDNAQTPQARCNTPTADLRKPASETDSSTNINTGINTEITANISTDIGNEIDTEISTEIGTEIGTEIDTGISTKPDINLAYHYDDNDVISLLNLALAELMRTGEVHVGIPAEDMNRLHDNICHWQTLKKVNTPAEGGSLLILPYSPMLEDGSPSNHWSALILGEHNHTDAITAAYIDPLDIQTSLPESLVRLLKQALPERHIHAQTITHTAQEDNASCGPRTVEDAIEISAYFCQNNRLPEKLENATERNAEAIRADHIEQLGGPQSAFAEKQRNWSPNASFHALGGATQLGQLREEFFDVFCNLSEEQHQQLKAAPRLETLEKMGLKFPEAYEPHRDWANRLIANYENTFAIQTNLIQALNTCQNQYPDMFATLENTWQETQDGLSVIKVIRGDMHGLIAANDAAAWASPEAQVLTRLGKSFFKALDFSNKNITEQSNHALTQKLNDANFVDMEIVEWALARTFPDAPTETTHTDSANDTPSERSVSSTKLERADSTDSFEDIYGLYS